MSVPTPFQLRLKFTSSSGAVVNFKAEMSLAWLLDYFVDADGVFHPLIYLQSQEIQGNSMILLCHSFTETYDVLCRTSRDQAFARANTVAADNSVGGHNAFTYEYRSTKTHRICVQTDDILNAMFSPATRPMVDYEFVYDVVDNFCSNLSHNITKTGGNQLSMLHALCEITRAVYEPADYESAIATVDPETKMIADDLDLDSEPQDTTLYVRDVAAVHKLLEIPICVSSTNNTQLWNPGLDHNIRNNKDVPGLIVADLTVWRPFRRDDKISWIGICLFKIEPLPNRVEGFVCVAQEHTKRAIAAYVTKNIDMASVDLSDDAFADRLRARGWLK